MARGPRPLLLPTLIFLLLPARNSMTRAILPGVVHEPAPTLYPTALRFNGVGISDELVDVQMCPAPVAMDDGRISPSLDCEWVVLSDLLKERAAGAWSVEPTGLIFDGTCGECSAPLVLTKMLAAGGPSYLTFSRLFDMVIDRYTTEWSEDRVVQLIQGLAWVVMARGTQPGEGPFVFFSVKPSYLDIMIRAFPHTPWMYIWAKPVQAGGSSSSARTKTSTTEHPESGRAVECTKDLPTMFLNLWLPGHFQVAISDKERDAMVNTYESIAAEQTQAEEAAGPTEEVAPSKQLARLIASLQAVSQRDVGKIEHMAWLKRQESYVYSRTGSRFVDIPACPDIPQRPKTYKVMDMIEHWHPDDYKPPRRHYSTLCRFDYKKEYDKAKAYRAADVPFVLYNLPHLKQARDKWLTPGYLSEAFGRKLNHVEIAKSSHFQYYHPEAAQKKMMKMDGYMPPSMPVGMPWDDWHDWAMANMHNATKNDAHMYMEAGELSFIKKDLRILTPQGGDLFEFPDDQSEINCRFGIRGTVVDTHFDGGRNMIAQIVGSRRWIINPPEQCNNSYLLPKSHPSYRHSGFDWAKPVDLNEFPLFAEAVGTEVIMTEGDVLYLPAFWLHTISTLNDAGGLCYQCNTFGGSSSVGMESLVECGFYNEELMVDLWAEETKKEMYRRAKKRKLNKKKLRELRASAKGKVKL